MIFYFTATGNSLFAARQIAKATGDAQLISIPQAIQQEGLEYTADSIGIVCPIYAGEAPSLVMDFLKKAAFKTSYLFMVMTYGADQTDAAEWTANAAKETGIAIDYIAAVKMIDNYLPGFDMDKEKTLDKNTIAQLESIITDIRAREKHIEEASAQGRQFHKMVAARFAQNPALNNGENILIGASCTGCGTCVKVCPLGNIRLEQGKAKRINPACGLFCLACVQNCPQKALSVKGEPNPAARFRNSSVSLQDLITANNQTHKE
jgi:ferredoxin